MPFFGVSDCGSTRRVFLIGRYAIKVAWADSWKNFLRGCVYNLDETTWSPVNSKNLTRIYWCSCTGLLSIHERVRPVRHYGLFRVDLAEICATSFIDSYFWMLDSKPENFGYRGTTLVKLDYGS